MGRANKGKKATYLVLSLALLGMMFSAQTRIRTKSSIEELAVKCYLPGLLYTEEKPQMGSWLWEKIIGQISVFRQLPYVGSDTAMIESQGMCEKIIKENSGFLQAKILEENQEAGPKSAGEESATAIEEEFQAKAEEVTSTAPPPVQGAVRAEATDIPLAQFEDFDFVINRFFTVDKTTSITREELNAPALVEKDLRLMQTNDKPQILLYHTHSQETFIDSTQGDEKTSILGVGDYLTSILQEQYGYQVLHVRDTYDMATGVLDRNKAYNYANDGIEQVLAKNPSIEVVIDLHRDGVPEGRHLVTDINGKPTAKIMFFNGLSQSRKNGPIESLYNPYIQDNLAFSLQMQLQAEKYYPDYVRTTYLKAYRYNLHFRPKSILVECGAQTNTVEEARNAMEPLADLLNKVLKGE